MAPQVGGGERREVAGAQHARQRREVHRERAAQARRVGVAVDAHPARGAHRTRVVEQRREFRVARVIEARRLVGESIEEAALHVAPRRRIARDHDGLARRRSDRGRRGCQRVAVQLARRLDLGRQRREGRQRVVALDDHARLRKAPRRHLEEFPDGGRHVGVVAVDAHVRQHGVPGEVHVGDGALGDRGEHRLRIDAEVVRVHDQIVDVEQHAAAGARAQRREELALADPGAREGDVGRGVLQQQPPPERVLHLRDARRDVIEHFGRVEDGQQVVRRAAAEARPAQVIAHEGGFDGIARARAARAGTTTSSASLPAIESPPRAAGSGSRRAADPASRGACRRRRSAYR